MKILIIDDDKQWTMLVKKKESKELTINISNSAIEGVVMAGSFKPDIIYLDVNLHDSKSGLEIIDALKSVCDARIKVMSSWLDNDEKKILSGAEWVSKDDVSRLAG